jgi:hypothetical protein
MCDNNDEQLGEQFDIELNNLISTLTDAVADRNNSETDKRRVAIEGKRYMMTLLSDKFGEYIKHTNPQSQQVFADMSTQFDTLIEQALNIEESHSQMGNSKPDKKDAEIQRLQEALKKSKQAEEQALNYSKILEKKVRDLESGAKSPGAITKQLKKSVGGKQPAEPARKRPTSAVSSVAA